MSWGRGLAWYDAGLRYNTGQGRRWAEGFLPSGRLPGSNPGGPTKSSALVEKFFINFFRYLLVLKVIAVSGHGI